MYLNREQVEHFQTNGFLLADNIFQSSEIEAMIEELPVLFAQDSPEVYRQKGSQAIRTVFAPEKFSKIFESVYQYDRLVNSVKQLLNDEVYLFQSKLNTKVALARGIWDWHQDFTFWKDDGMPEPKALTVAIYLNDVTEFNGPMIVIPGSHRLGTASCEMKNPDGVHDENLKYVISQNTIKQIAEQCGGMVSTKGKKGSVLFFDCNILHASAQNLHYENRDILMLTYNSVSNKTNKVENPRADFMVKRDFSPVKPILSLK